MSTTTTTHLQHISMDGAGGSIVTRVQSTDITLAVVICVHDTR